MTPLTGYLAGINRLLYDGNVLSSCSEKPMKQCIALGNPG